MSSSLDSLSARRVLPFAAAAGLALLTALIPPSPDPRLLALAGAIVALLALCPVAFAWARPPAPLSVLLPLLFLVVVAILRDATGGSGSGFAPLVLLSVFWVALYGERWQLGLVIVGVALLFAAPLSGLLGGEYHSNDVRYAIIWLSLASLIGFTAQSMVSRLRDQQRDLSAQRDFLDAMFDSAGSLVTVLDLEGRVLRINPACERLGGFTEAEMVGRPFWELLVPEEGREAAARGWANRGPERLGGVIEVPMVSRDGGRHVVHWTLTTLRDQEGEPSALVATGLDVSERKRLERELKHLAEHDPLTGLLNRRRFEAEVARHLGHIARYGEVGALLTFDIDGFKSVNDTLGHAKGDELIRAVAISLGAELRRTDQFGRLGGDEFAILLPEANREQAVAAAERLVATARRQRLELPAGGWRGIAISVGLVMFSAAHHLSPEQPLVAADLAMYEAKRAGGDGLRVAPALACRDAPK